MDNPSNIPAFVQGDERKALRVTIKNAAGVAQDVTNWTVTLWATGIISGDQPGGGVGLAGNLVTPASGIVEFPGLGAECDIGTGRMADVYWYRVKSVDQNNNLSWSDPLGHFKVSAAPA